MGIVAVIARSLSLRYGFYFDSGSMRIQLDLI